MNKIVVISLVAIVAVLAVWLTTKNANNISGPVSTPISTPISTPTPVGAIKLRPTPEGNAVIYTDDGYSPATLTIKKGQTVTWKNQSSVKMWTASAMHPTHKVYPDSDIALCGQPTTSMFDACMGLSSGQEWSFKFNNAGTWKYHNHMNSSHFGTVIVEP